MTIDPSLLLTDKAHKKNAEFEIVLAFFRRFSFRSIARLFIGVSAVYGFCVFYDMHSYMPWHFKTLKALDMTIESHLIPLLATLQVHSRWRFVIAGLLIPGMAGVYFLLWHRNEFSMIIAAMVTIFLFVKMLRGKQA